MPRYEYACAAHGRTLITKDIDQAGTPEVCAVCGEQLRRIFSAAGFIMRPSGYNLRPGDKNFSNFDREAELGEIRSNGDKPESGGAKVEIPRPRIDHSKASVAAERNLRQAVEAAWNAAH